MTSDTNGRTSGQDAEAPVLVRVYVGAVGPVHAEDGAVIRLPAAVARDLVARGDAAPAAVSLARKE